MVTLFHSPLILLPMEDFVVRGLENELAAIKDGVFLE